MCIFGCINVLMALVNEMKQQMFIELSLANGPNKNVSTDDTKKQSK